MKKTITKVSTILLLLIKSFDLVNAQSATKGVSCHQTVTDGIIHDITCTDFSSPDQQKETISSCSLTLFIGGIDIYTWGRKYDVNAEDNFVHVVEAREPTERSCSIKVVIHDDFLDILETYGDKQKEYATVYIKANDLNQFQFTRWVSPRFRIYSLECKNPKTMNKIENCTLEDYGFGEGLSKKYDITSQQLSTERACSDKCENEKNCTFSSWKGSDQSCRLLNGLKPREWEKSNPPFFCSRNGSTITEKEDLCKPVSQVVHESQAQLWMFDSSTKKLVNRNGNWKYETLKDYGNWTKGRMDVNNHSTLINKFGRFLAAKPISAEEVGSKETGRSYIGTHIQYFILHGAFLRRKEDFDRKKTEGECGLINRNYHNLEYYRLKDKFGKIVVSNLNCTNDTEAVLASNSEIMQVYIEKTTEVNDIGWNVNKHFLAHKEDGSDEVVENSVIYDPKMYWLKGKASKDGFFTLKHPKSGKILTSSHAGFRLRDAPYKLKQDESIFSSALTDQSWYALQTKSMKNSEIITKAQGKSIVHCWDQARNRKSPFFMWNPSENGTCHLSKTLSNSTLVDHIYSFAQCEEFATNENSLFFWDAKGEGSCHLITEDSQICTSPAGSKCSKDKPDSEPEEGSLTVRTDYCTKVDFSLNQCKDSTHNLTDHDEYQCARLDENNCTFYKACPIKVGSLGITKGSNLCNH